MKTNIAHTNATVYVVDDDPEVCKALCWLLESVNFIVETFHNPMQFLDMFNPNRRGCLILDVRMPEKNGFELLKEIKIRNNHLPVIMITGHGDIPMAVRAMKAGAADFLSKPFNDQYLLEQIQKLINRNIQTIEDDCLESIYERFATLTTREHQVLELIVSGKLNKQIASELGIANSTVELHRARLMKKMRAKTLAKLVKIYFSVHQ